MGIIIDKKHQMYFVFGVFFHKNLNPDILGYLNIINGKSDSFYQIG